MSNGDKAAYPHGGFREEGLTKRELFAAMAMQGALSARADMNVRGYEGWIEEFSREAIRFADALLAELDKSP